VARDLQPSVTSILRDLELVLRGQLGTKERELAHRIRETTARPAA